MRRLLANGFRLPVLFMSGYTDDPVDPADFDDVPVASLAKPFTRDQLLDRVAQLLCTPVQADRTAVTA